MKLKAYIMSNELSVNISLAFLACVIMLCTFADFLANDRPIVAINSAGEIEFFATEPGDSGLAIYAPIRYSSGLDLSNDSLAPFEHPGHHLGTDHLGRDVLAALIHGSRRSLGISLLSMLVATFVGMTLGGLAGFFGDYSLRISVVDIIYLTFILVLVFYVGVVIDYGFGAVVLTLIVLIIMRFLGRNWLPSGSRMMDIPMDFMTLKFTEVFSSIPTYFLILALVAFLEPNWFLFAIIVGLTSWVGIARLTRAEMISLRTLGYIESAETLGFSRLRIFCKHAIPNSLGPLPYAITFGIAGIIVAESTLSFLGVGLPPDNLSWGNFLSGFKHNSSAWWVAFFPGMMIFLTILSLHIIGRWLDSRYNPRQ